MGRPAMRAQGSLRAPARTRPQPQWPANLRPQLEHAREVAARHAEIERARAQLALFVTSIVPQGRAALESATVAFRAGTADLQAVLESQAALYDFEVAYLSALSDFAKGLADLERAVGAEVLP